MKGLHPVLIEWVDSRIGPYGWEQTEDVDVLRPALCVTVGLLVDDAKDYKTVALSANQDNIMGRMTIPTSAIRKVRRLR